MSFINYSSKEVNCKVVYCGPVMSGKTSNLQHIYRKTAPESKGKIISLSTENERTLFFDFLPLSIGEIRGFHTKFHLYTLPGNVVYSNSLSMLLKGVDGIIFVADSGPDRQEENKKALDALGVELHNNGYDITELPMAIQYNKRDLPDAMPIVDMRTVLNAHGVPDFEAVATSGVGVFDSLKEVTRRVLVDLRKGVNSPSN